MLGRLERAFVAAGMEATDWVADGGGGVSVFGVSTTRRTRGWRGAEESETRETPVKGVFGREPIVEVGTGPWVLG